MDGNLEAHATGFRFVLKKGAHAPIDILYVNVRNAFYQPADRHSTRILIHFCLRQPIKIGTHSTTDVQFYVEYMEESENVNDAGR